ncbi:unnamed protein product, partial [Rotaria sp. Silwood1]
QAVVTINNKHDFSINKYHPNSGTPTKNYPESSQTPAHQQIQLSLSMDSVLVSNINLNRRHLGDNFDERIQQRHQSFVVTGNNRYIISTGYWNKITCVCRSEVTIAENCFLATGSRVYTVCIWIWNGIKGAIVDREYPNQKINPSPAAILTGHNREITCLWISAERGIVLSDSEQSLVLQHILNSDILHSFENPSKISTPRLLSSSNDGDIIVCYDHSKLCLYTLNGKLMRQAIFEDETIQCMVLNIDSQYTVIGCDRVLDYSGKITSEIMIAATGEHKKQYVLVPGGVGFIGSHCVIELVTAGYTPIVVDNDCNSSAGLVGENPIGKPNNLMPFTAQIAVGRLPYVNIFGTDYDTPNSTGVRDYIHVVDVAIGHIVAMKQFEKNCGLKIYNLGTGKTISYRECARRSGDLATVYADATLACQELGWTA